MSAPLCSPCYIAAMKPTITAKQITVISVGHCIMHPNLLTKLYLFVLVGSRRIVHWRTRIYTDTLDMYVDVKHRDWNDVDGSPCGPRNWNKTTPLEKGQECHSYVVMTNKRELQFTFTSLSISYDCCSIWCYWLCKRAVDPAKSKSKLPKDIFYSQTGELRHRHTLTEHLFAVLSGPSNL